MKKKELKMKRCKYCKSPHNLTVDHKIPKIQGGSNKLSNLQCLCKRCNSIKSGMSDRQVRSLLRWFLSIQRTRVMLGHREYGEDKKTVDNLVVEQIVDSKI
jgi:hypothetical protein